MYPGSVDGIVSSGGGTIVNVDGPDTQGATTITPDNLNFFARHALPQISQLLPMTQLTSFNGRLAKAAITDPKAIRMPSGPLSADIIRPVTRHTACAPIQQFVLTTGNMTRCTTSTCVSDSSSRWVSPRLTTS